jgi:ferrous iron transport protein B
MTAPAFRVAVLLGNPNTGKTTLFNALSGLNHRVGNYPGVTVESKTGKMTCGDTPFDLVDLPGTYSLAPRSPDEMVAVDVVLGRSPGEGRAEEQAPRPDVVVSIVDASNLERNLYLTTQALELGLPVVIALNMVDVAQSQGITIDIAKLQERLGVPVVPIQANKKIGLDVLKTTIAQAAGGQSPTQRPTFPEAFEREIDSLSQKVPKTPRYLLERVLLDVGGWTEQRLTARFGESLRDDIKQRREVLAKENCPIPAIEARTRYGWIRERLTGCVTRPAQRPVSLTDRIDQVLTHRVWGTLIFLAIMFGMFALLFWAATPAMDLIKEGQGWLAGTVEGLLPAGPFTSLITEGVINGVGAVVVFLPQILILFLFIALLEDCGYMARAAFLMDKLMSRCGLSGKSFIPMLSSMACAVPGIMATRVIEDRRDRLATILVAPLMSCSARLPVYALLTGAFLTEGYSFWVPATVVFCMYLIGLIVAPLVAWCLKSTLLRGATPVFVMEMPAYKVPSLSVVARRIYDAATSFLYRAGTVILASMVVVWVLLNFPAGTYREQIADLKEQLEALKKETAEGEQPEQKQDEEKQEVIEAKIHALEVQWKKGSILGQLGQAIEPAVKPLGWDWRIGVAALASFPAREVIVGTLGVLYAQGETDPGEEKAVTKLGDEVKKGGLSLAGALSLMVFFALCCQCASTLAVIYRETKSWTWPVFTFVYMTVLAYVGALVTFQIGAFFGG